MLVVIDPILLYNSSCKRMGLKASILINNASRCGSVAEQLIRNQQVGGSNPPIGSTSNSQPASNCGFLCEYHKSKKLVKCSHFVHNLLTNLIAYRVYPRISYAVLKLHPEPPGGVALRSISPANTRTARVFIKSKSS